MSLPPKEIPLGAMRFNSDSQKLEYFNGDVWMQVHTFSPNLGGNGGPAANPTGNSADQVSGARGLIAGGNSGKKIDYINIATTGNGVDFGNLAEITYQQASFGSNTRSICAGGAGPSTNPNDVIEYITFATTGDTADFGNLSVARRNPGAVSNQTRGVVAGGGNVNELTVYDTMDYVTIASTGHAVDFGNKTNNIMTPAGSINSPTRGVFAGGASTAPSYTETNVMDYITIASTGHAQDFGDLRQATAAPAGCSNAVRGIIAGGATDLVPGQTLTADISYLTIATTGNAMDFGDLIVATNFGHSAGMSSPVRGVFACGYVAPGPSATRDTIQYIAIATQGNAVDFGDSVTSERYRSANSNAHGGL